MIASREEEKKKIQNANKLTICNHGISKYPKIVAKSGGWQLTEATAWWLVYICGIHCEWEWLCGRENASNELVTTSETVAVIIYLEFMTRSSLLWNRHFLFRSNTSACACFISFQRSKKRKQWIHFIFAETLLLASCKNQDVQSLIRITVRTRSMSHKGHTMRARSAHICPKQHRNTSQ